MGCCNNQPDRATLILRRPLLNRRMMEKSCWAVARWAETYLLPDQAIGPGLEQAFGRQGSGSQVAQYLLSLVLRLLWGDQWLGEVDLHRILVVRMLPALVKHDGTRDALLGTQEWQHHLIGEPQHSTFERFCHASRQEWTCRW